MDNRVRLKVLGISYTQLQSGAYALLLAEEDGPYRIPVVIGASEAQSIAIRMEKIVTPRPLTHDLFVSFAQAFGVRLREVFIYKFEDGVFSSELTFTDGERQIVLDARTSDAIAIAMRCNAPIWTTRAIVDETGFIIENDPTVGARKAGREDDEDNHDSPKPENLAVEELQKMLAKLVEEENYEEASRISMILKAKLGDRNEN
ncbi:MAG: bifunctional nuclease family protein [Muribaculaceae bacterium]|nr:bifunctional nuclease family protein [Muribaculaceae bacterium]